ncbi:hypothetical protein I302_108244 [Kwoniella bestiolae CBS 10118]|uniref:Uncharacterized protein n=1 Tax=Kwoniella bestiolae CBS 10118 TaxID=1296100 RepID=A0A1B9FWA6_9TREE|nr:hypothetical protein I302_07390 [Kwoniella bestiolae CBS 10118]OCF23040.1 hypothetical protein I302_07390 [Kwoniella bestiolae CBS 10118]
MSPSHGRPDDLTNADEYDSDASTIVVSDEEEQPRPPERERVQTREQQPKKKGMTREEYEDRLYEHHAAYLKQEEESRWINRTERGRKFKKVCTKVYGWWFWRWFLRKFPYIQAGLNGVGGVVIASTGPALGIWSVESGRVRYGAWGSCTVVGGGEARCSTEIFYDGPEVANWSNKTLSVVLLSYGVVAILQLLTLLYTYLFIRHRLRQRCTDPELQTSGNPNLRARKRRSLKWFERIMDLSSVGYLGLGLTLWWWAGKSNADGMTGWDLSICLTISPVIWLLFRMFYRSRLLSRATKKLKRGMDIVKNGPDSYDSDSESDTDDDAEIDSRKNIRYSRIPGGSRVEGPNAQRRRTR